MDKRPGYGSGDKAGCVEIIAARRRRVEKRLARAFLLGRRIVEFVSAKACAGLTERM